MSDKQQPGYYRYARSISTKLATYAVPGMVEVTLNYPWIRFRNMRLAKLKVDGVKWNHRDCIRVLREEGSFIRNLYNGYAQTFRNYGVYKIIMIGSYLQLGKRLKAVEYDEKGHPHVKSIAGSILAGGLAGGLAGVQICGFVERWQVLSNSLKDQPGNDNLTPRQVREKGFALRPNLPKFRNRFVGLGGTLWRDVLFSAAVFGFKDVAQDRIVEPLLQRLFPSFVPEEHTVATSAATSLCVGSVVGLLTQPLDAARIQQQSVTSANIPKYLETLRGLYSVNGVRGMLFTIGDRVIRIGIGAVLLNGTKEFLIRAFQEKDDGREVEPF